MAAAGSMTLPGLTIVSIGLLFLGFGILLLVNPQSLSIADIQLPTATAKMEVRAFYGGLEIGLGLYLLLGTRPEHLRRTIQLAIYILGGIVSGRAYGAIADGIDGSYLWGVLSIEAPMLLLALISWNAVRSSPQDNSAS